MNRIFNDQEKSQMTTKSASYVKPQTKKKTPANIIHLKKNIIQLRRHHF